MADLRASSKAITTLLGTRSRILDGSVLGAKIIVLAGTAIIGVAKWALWPADVTYIAVAAVLVAGLFTLIAERTASTTLSEARIAMDDALEQERKLEAAEKAYDTELDRLSHFQVARDLVRALLEDIATSTAEVDEISVIQLMLSQARRQLFLAHGFAMNDFYTICVYREEVDTAGEPMLVCKANIRAIDCDLRAARKWKKGVGAAGGALATGEEVIVSDLNDPALGSLYKIPEKKIDDDTRYRSIVAQPISSDGKGDLWGVVVATSNKPGHFSLSNRDYVNVTQSLAGMIALAVKLVRCKQQALQSRSHS